MWINKENGRSYFFFTEEKCYNLTLKEFYTIRSHTRAAWTTSGKSILTAPKCLDRWTDA